MVQDGIICHSQQPEIHGNMNLTMHYTVSRNANSMHNVRHSSCPDHLSQYQHYKFHWISFGRVSGQHAVHQTIIPLWYLLKYVFGCDVCKLDGIISKYPRTLQWRHNGAITCQISGLTIVYSIVYSDADQRKHQSSASLTFLRGNHGGPVNSPHKWPVMRRMFPFDDVIMEISCDCPACLLLTH